MGNCVSLTTLENEVGQGGAVGRFSRPATLPHYPTPKGVVRWWGRWACRRSACRGGANLADQDSFAASGRTMKEAVA